MFKKRPILFLIMIVLFVFTASVSAQDAAIGNVRFVQIFYQNADIYIDEVLAFPNVAFTVGTDFTVIAAGKHIIATTQAGASPETSTATPLDVTAGHDYTIITMGEFEKDSPTLLKIDQTADFATYDAEGNSAIIVQNLPGAIPVDVWFVDQLKIERLEFGGYGTASAPLGEFTAQAVMAGDPKTVLFESHYFAVPRTVSLAYLTGTFPDKINRNFFTTSRDNMMDYLAAHTALENSKLSTLYELIEASGLGEQLSGDTQYTLFAPTNDAFAALPAGTLDQLKSDPAALANLLGYHLVEGRMGPYELTGEHSLTSVQGAALEVEFQPVEKPLAVNGVVTGLQHRVSNGVIYLIDSVLTPPA